MDLMLRSALYGIRLHFACFLLFMAVVVFSYTQQIQTVGRESANLSLHHFLPVLVVQGLLLAIFYGLLRLMRAGSRIAIGLYVIGWTATLFIAMRVSIELTIFSPLALAFGVLAFVGLAGFFRWLREGDGGKSFQ